MVEKKRGHPSAGSGGGGAAQTKRQRKSAVKASKQSYFTPKPPSLIQKIDIPLDQLMPQERIDLIADLSEAILEDPMSAVSSSRSSIVNVDAAESSQSQPQYQKTQSKIQKLIDLASPSTNGHDAHAARLAMLSLLAIFQDILPSYRIRLPTEAEMAVRVSKEIKQTWDYERRLLQVYQKYLQLLERTWENGKWGNQFRLDDTEKKGKHNNSRGGGGPPTTLAATAILSLSQLLQTCYNFNFRSNILQMVVRQANNRSSDEVRSSCCNALSTMFAKDVQGEASLEAVKRMAKMLKDGQSKSNHRGGRMVHPDLLNT
jgi:nucleolar complex protein 3